MSSSEGEDEDYIFYRDREEWKDVTPIPQDDGPASVVAIAYTDKFRDAYDYLRAILKTNEHSERALQLVTDAITLNAANYTVWHFRRILLRSLKKDLRVELQYITGVIRKQPKNYQVWYHRGIIVQWLNDPTGELEFIDEMLGEDAKNYHCWQHRQLVLNHFKLWDKEVEYTSTLICKDIRNNSAWNQRYYAVINTTGFVHNITQDEIYFCKEMIEKAPNNESVWNYLKGVLAAASGGLDAFPDLKDYFEEKLAGGMDSPYLLAFLIDYYDESLEKCFDRIVAERAMSLCDTMATDVDTIRKEYWNYMKRTIQSLGETSTNLM